jgi:hypothetical protein
MAPLEPDILIVPLKRSDLGDLTSMRNDPQVVRFTRMPDPPPADFFESWFARYEDGRLDGTREAFAIVDGERSVLGIALAPAIDRETATVELGYVIHGGRPRSRRRHSRARASHRLGIHRARCPATGALHQHRERRVETRGGEERVRLRGHVALDVLQTGRPGGHGDLVEAAIRSVTI